MSKTVAYLQANKQAYLIIAHKDDIVFRTLIQMLDHPKNDIFIHMDAKNKSYDPAETLKLVKCSRIFHVPRIKVTWGGYSQIHAELTLLEVATSEGNYEHYHLLSGQCLPIKKQDEIITFFESHRGAEFMSIRKNFEGEERVRFYYPFQEIKGRKGNVIVRAINQISIKLQRSLHIWRNKAINFRRGGNWFSITDGLARYVLSKRDWIRTVFHDTLCCDEVFLQTITADSPFAINLFSRRNSKMMSPANMRLIDWKRGRPYTFRMSDLEQIKSSSAMFARKFDGDIDTEIIMKIQELYS